MVLLEMMKQRIPLSMVTLVSVANCLVAACSSDSANVRAAGGTNSGDAGTANIAAGGDGAGAGGHEAGTAGATEGAGDYGAGGTVPGAASGSAGAASDSSGGATRGGASGIAGAAGDGSGGAAPGGASGIAGAAGDSPGGAAPGGASAKGGAGGDSSVPPEVSCTQTTSLQTGRNYGPYTLYAIRLEPTILVGDYTIAADAEGTAYIYRDELFVGDFLYDTSLSLGDNQTQTLRFSGLFEFDVRSQNAADLSELPSSFFDGCHVLSVSEETPLAAGSSYGAFLLEEVIVDPNAAAGIYTFFAESGNTGAVELRRDGVPIDTLSYEWTTTIGDGGSFTFEFPAVVALVVTRPVGTSNLFGLAESLFDGRQELRITP